MKRIILLLPVLALLLIAATPAATESLSVLLQKGIYAEETEGDLEAAITIYQGIVDQARQSQPLVAQALYRLSLCHAKKGNDDLAVANLRELIRKYPQESDILAQARARLAQWDATEDETTIDKVDSAHAGKSWTETFRQNIQAGLKPTGKAERGVVVRQVWAEPTSVVCPAPDGLHAACIDLIEMGDLELRNLETAGHRNLTHRGGDGADGEFATSCTFSPDGARVAFHWVNGDQGNQLKVLDLKSSKTRTLRDFGTRRMFDVADWSPDGKFLAGWMRDGQMFQAKTSLSLIATDDGAETVIHTWERQIPQNIRFSRDSRFLVFNLNPDPFDKFADPDTSEADPQVMIVRLGKEHAMESIPGLQGDTFVDWTPKGEELIFLTDRRGPQDLWTIRLEDGRAVGQPQLLKADVGEIYPVGMSRDGVLFYTTSVKLEDIHVARLDVDSGKLLAGPRLVETPTAGSNDKATLSPDGKYLFYRSGARNPSAWRVDLETWEFHQFKNSSPWTLGLGWWWASPDNRSLLVGGYHPGQKRDAYWVMDMTTESITLIPQKNPELSYGATTLAIDRENVYLLGQNRNADAFTVVTYNIGSGQLTEHPAPVGPNGWQYWLSGPWLAPDGRSLFFKRSDGSPESYHLAVHDLIEGVQKNLLATRFDFHLTIHPEGRQISLAGLDEEGNPAMAMRLAWIDGRLEKLCEASIPEGFQGIWPLWHKAMVLLEKIPGKPGDAAREVWTLDLESAALRGT